MKKIFFITIFILSLIVLPAEASAQYYGNYYNPTMYPTWQQTPSYSWNANGFYSQEGLRHWNNSSYNTPTTGWSLYQQPTYSYYNNPCSYGCAGSVYGSNNYYNNSMYGQNYRQGGFGFNLGFLRFW